MKFIIPILALLLLVACKPVKVTQQYYNDYVNPVASIDYEDTLSADIPAEFLDDYYTVDSKIVRLANQLDLLIHEWMKIGLNIKNLFSRGSRMSRFWIRISFLFPVMTHLASIRRSALYWLTSVLRRAGFLYLKTIDNSLSIFTQRQTGNTRRQSLKSI